MMAENLVKFIVEYADGRTVQISIDTFPWRQPDFARGMQLFVADHPASLAWT